MDSLDHIDFSAIELRLAAFYAGKPMRKLTVHAASAADAEAISLSERIHTAPVGSIVDGFRITERIQDETVCEYMGPLNIEEHFAARYGAGSPDEAVKQALAAGRATPLPSLDDFRDGVFRTLVESSAARQDDFCKANNVRPATDEEYHFGAGPYVALGHDVLHGDGTGDALPEFKQERQTVPPVSVGDLFDQLQAASDSWKATQAAKKAAAQEYMAAEAEYHATSQSIRQAIIARVLESNCRYVVYKGDVWVLNSKHATGKTVEHSLHRCHTLNLDNPNP